MMTDIERQAADPVPERVVLPRETLEAEVIVIGSGPGGTITAMQLAEAGCDVMLLEEGPRLPLDSASHFSRDEIVQKYRNGGTTVGFGTGKTAYVEGRCVGGGSEVNRGLYARLSPDAMAEWNRDCAVDGLTEAAIQPHHEACEALVRPSYLPDAGSPLSLKLHEGASRLGWRVEEVPRLVCYQIDPKTWHVITRKQSMTETCVPKFLRAGGRLLTDIRVLRLSRSAGQWRVHGLRGREGVAVRSVALAAETVIVACGPIQAPALLRRSGITRHVGNNLRFHPMIKMVAVFPDEMNLPGQLDPVHEIKQFDPRFSLGCSISSRSLLALTMVDHLDHVADVDEKWRHMGIYYVQTTGGRGLVRTVPTFNDPIVTLRYDAADMRDFGEGLRKLGECLFAAGAVALYPAMAGAPVLRSPADLRRIPIQMPPEQANLSALHLFATCPMGENELRCATDSFGKVRGTDGLHVTGAAVLPGATIVNPQGAVMAIAHRNAIRFLERRRPRSKRLQ